MTNGCIIQEPYPPDEDQEGYEAWCEREALLRVVRAAKEYHAITLGHWSDFAPTAATHEGMRLMKSSMLFYALEALPEHLRKE